MALMPFVFALSYAEFNRTDSSAFLRILLTDQMRMIITPSTNQLMNNPTKLQTSQSIPVSLI